MCKPLLDGVTIIFNNYTPMEVYDGPQRTRQPSSQNTNLRTWNQGFTRSSRFQVKELTSTLIQEVLEGELENELGYSKWDYRNKKTSNSRNGLSKKTLKSSQGEITVQIPRDRTGDRTGAQTL